MNENSYQKLAELVGRSPRLLGPGGLFGGLNQEHGLMVDFIKFTRGLKIDKNMSPETVNIGSFVAYLGDHKNAEEVARKLYDMRQNGEIVDNPHVKAKNTLLNLAETLIDLGVGEKPENVGGDYEGVLRETLTRAGATPTKSEERSEAEAPGEEIVEVKQKGAASEPSASAASTHQQKKGEAKREGPAPASHGAAPQGIVPADNQPKGERDVTSPEMPLSTMGEYLTDQVSIVKKEEAQAGALAIGASEASISQQKKDKTKWDETVSAPESATLQEPVSAAPQGAENAENQPEEGRDLASPETPLSTIPSDKDSGLLRPLTAPVIREAAGGIVDQAAGQATSRQAGQATGEFLAGTRSTPGGERRHIAELPGGGRMLRKGPKKQGQRQEQRQGRGTGESGQDQGRQTGPGRNPAQDFANQQAAQPQKSRVGRKVAGGAGIAGSLALMKGMYGGAAANAATFGILQTILDLLT